MSLERIAAGVDFSPESLLAVDHAMAIAQHVGAALTLIHVGAVPDPTEGVPASMATTAETWRGVVLARLAEDRARLADLHQRLSGQGVEVSQVVVDGFPDVAVAEAAHRLGVGLVVVGTHGRTGLRRVVLGSVAEKTVRLAEASVLVVRGAAPAGGYRRVVVGTDFSPHADRAVELALALAAPDAVVRVINAWSPLPYASFEIDAIAIVQLREAAEAVAEVHRARLLARPRPPTLTLSLEVVDGSAAGALDELSATCDLVVVGSHGRRGIRRFVLGSVAETTVRHAGCSVLVAR